MSIDLTVAIPTYNGESSLSEVIERLRHQTDVEHLNWEIIIVDNNSKDGTEKLIQEYQEHWNHPFALRYILESEQGAAFARNRAVKEAKGEIIAFLDDDNLPANNWITEACKFLETHPKAGVLASQIHGNFEVEPPENIKPILFYLAITERGTNAHIYEPKRKGFPPSAGLVVRRNAWKDNVPTRPFLVGRVGSSMLGSEDAEALFYIYKAGWEIWYNPGMEIEHVIPVWRLEKNYLISLMRGVGLARYHLRMLLIKTWQRPFAFFLYFANDIRKLILYFLKYKGVMKNDVLVAAEMERLLATVISPFYLWRLKFSKILRIH
jgi:glycosyltransferase involved in cell wall biosynthesis